MALETYFFYIFLLLCKELFLICFVNTETQGNNTTTLLFDCYFMHFFPFCWQAFFENVLFSSTQTISYTLWKQQTSLLYGTEKLKQNVDPTGRKRKNTLLYDSLENKSLLKLICQWQNVLLSLWNPTIMLSQFPIHLPKAFCIKHWTFTWDYNGKPRKNKNWRKKKLKFAIRKARSFYHSATCNTKEIRK
jgi:hypothetical protein